MKILLLYGWTSKPGGVKPTYLAQHGHEVINPKLPDDDFEEAVGIAQAEFDKHQPDAIVGSSRGGAVELVIRHLIDGSIRQTFVGLEALMVAAMNSAAMSMRCSSSLLRAAFFRFAWAASSRPYAPAPRHRAKSPAPGIPGPAASGRSLLSAALRRTPCASAARPAPALGVSASASSSTRPVDAAATPRTASSLDPGCTR